MSTDTLSSYRPDIQGLRAVAVLLVIAAHAGLNGFDGGFVGVDIFFVISGFVITGLLMRQPERSLLSNLRHFYVRRILRIVPAATVVLMATVFASYFILKNYFDAVILEDVRWATLFSANFRLIDTSADYFMSGASATLITHFWSLAIEEQFYFVYPLLVFALTYVSRRHTTVLRGVLVGIIAISALWSWHLTPLNQVVAYYSPFTRFWELAIGGFVATLSVNTMPKPTNAMLSLISIIGLVVSVSWLNGSVQFPGVAAWFPCGFTALLIYSGKADAKAGPSKWLSSKPLTYIGDISYSLYLWHFIWLMLPGQMEFPPEGFFVKPLLIAGSFACAIASYHLMENPIRHSKRLINDGWATLILLAICLLLSYNSTLVVEHLWLANQ